MIRRVLLAAPLILQATPFACAWGTLGHDTVAYIAENFVSTKTKEFCQRILNDTSSSYLANIATWADSYRYTAEGTFSASFHYIDAEDDPPHACNVDFGRDCGDEGCVVSAIANYTSRVRDSSLNAWEVNKALRWIVHFVGDIHQPLHDEAIEIGGNTINVTFDGVATNLHHIWDSNMAEKLRGGYNLTFAQSWAVNLTEELKHGDYKKEKSSWLTGIDIDDAIGTSMIWARDANSYVCTTVIPDGVEAVEGRELDGAYYEAAIPVVELQIAKAGYRLAAWLNLIATNKTSLPVGKGYSARPIESISMLSPSNAGEISAVKLARRAFGHKC